MLEQIQIAEKLKKCNETVKKLYGEGFDTAMVDYKRYIKAAMQKHNLKSEIEGAMQLVEDSIGMEGSDVFTMKVFAACVELMEGRP